jgi:plastocyanin
VGADVHSVVLELNGFVVLVSEDFRGADNDASGAPRAEAGGHHLVVEMLPLGLAGQYGHGPSIGLRELPVRPGRIKGGTDPLKGGRMSGSASLALTLVLVLGLVATACAGEEKQQTKATDGDSIMVAGEKANDHGTENVAGVSDFELVMNDFYFRPTVLSGEAGQTISLELLNDGGNPHTFTLDALRIDIEVQSSQNGGTKVTFPESGALLFYCRFHAGGGMRGGLSAGGDLTAAAGSEGGGDTRTGPYG